jgi:uncharacterized protein (DUF1697 family)
MKELVALLEGLGCEDVRTYIQSGNAVFRSRRTPDEGFAGEIREAIAARFGFEPQVLLLSQTMMERAVRNNPFDTSVGKALHFGFLTEEPADPDLAALEDLKAPSEEWQLKDDVFYLYAPDGIGRSKLAAAVERKLGVSMTARNWNTVSRLMALAAEVTENG